jgi:serine/threonine protein kinase
MAASPGPHPSAEILRAFGSGKLTDAGAAAVVSHLENCPACCHKAADLSGDSFLDRLRAARGRSAQAEPNMPLPGVGPTTRPTDPGSTPAPPAAQPLGAAADLDAAMAPPPLPVPALVLSAAGSAALDPIIDPAPSPPAPDLLPELRNHPDYVVLRELARGGMGVVYLVKNKRMDRLEVLKVVNRQLLDSPGTAERFLREIRSAAKLSHRNIVTAYAAPQAGDLLLFAMEYVEGEDLTRVVQTRGPLPVVNACYYAQQVALGLQHAHDKGMVHRDIKPQNLILAREGKRHVVKILDFGLAKATREHEGTGHGLTGTGMMLGTPQYMAPEQTRNPAAADIRADIYSLGCTLYFLLTGRPPFQADSLYELLHAHHVQEATPLPQIRGEVPAELAAVVARMMAKDPAQRYQTPAEVAEALAPFVKPVLKPSPAGVPQTPIPTARGFRTSEAGNKQVNKGTEQDTAPPPLLLRETVVEGSATIARATTPTAQDQFRPPAVIELRIWQIAVGAAVLVLLGGVIGLCVGIVLSMDSEEDVPAAGGEEQPRVEITCPDAVLYRGNDKQAPVIPISFARKSYQGLLRVGIRIPKVPRVFFRVPSARGGKYIIVRDIDSELNPLLRHRYAREKYKIVEMDRTFHRVVHLRAEEGKFDFDVGRVIPERWKEKLGPWPQCIGEYKVRIQVFEGRKGGKLLGKKEVHLKVVKR